MLEITSTPLVLIAILGTVGILLPIISIARKEQGSNSFYAVIAFAALIAAMGYVGYQFINENVVSSALFSDDVIVDDAFGGFFAIAMLIVAIFTTVGSFNYMRKHNSPAVYYSLILLATIGMILVAYSTDLVMLFVAWELMSIPTYVLVGYMKKNPSSNEAALKYFLFGALSSAIIIYGISISYGLTGSTNIGEVIQGYATLDPSLLPLALLSVGMFIAGFGFKMGLVPFHQWLPDTYDGAPPTITALLAAATKKAGFAATIRVVVLGMVVLNIDWTLALGVIAVMTMTVGNIAAIMQKNISRMLAYSSIAHAGYILIGLAIAPHSSLGLQGSLYQIMNQCSNEGCRIYCNCRNCHNSCSNAHRQTQRPWKKDANYGPWPSYCIICIGRHSSTLWILEQVDAVWRCIGCRLYTVVGALACNCRRSEQCAVTCILWLAYKKDVL